MDQEKFNLKQTVMRYYTQLTSGCGNKSCANPNCASSPRFSFPDLNSSQLLKKSLTMAKEGEKLCKRLKGRYIANASKKSPLNQKNNSEVKLYDKNFKNDNKNNLKQNDNKNDSKNDNKIIKGHFTNIINKKSPKITCYLKSYPNYKISTNFTVFKSMADFVNLTLNQLKLNSKIRSLKFIEFLSARVIFENTCENSDKSGLELTEDTFREIAENNDFNNGNISIVFDVNMRFESEFSSDENLIDGEDFQEYCKELNLFSGHWNNLIETKDPKLEIKSKHSKDCIQKSLKGDFEKIKSFKNFTILENIKNKNKLIIKNSLFNLIQFTEKINITKFEEIILIFIVCEGGKFSIAAFQNGEFLSHNSISRYVIRKKQGGRQLNHDVSSSAGSYMRTYHEKRLKEEIEELYKKFQPLINKSSGIFWHAPGKINYDYIFKSKTNKISETDRRVIRINSSEIFNSNLNSKNNLNRDLKATFGDICVACKALIAVKIFLNSDCGCL